MRAARSAPAPRIHNGATRTQRCTLHDSRGATGHRERYTTPPRAGHASVLPPPRRRLRPPPISSAQRSIPYDRCVSPQCALETTADRARSVLHGALSARASPSSSMPRAAPVTPAPLAVPGRAFVAFSSLRGEC
ncbi:hypothetical protein HYPSUDRAFT_68571 [Hypholoma sublateritium FD-334 SS-4]|uniref:Uncharacterized protein n=1 Tax=Hypholoma sublateritium (strain FD-334 SS-4) TaxID=945553 RepID=A0A0D2MAH4_HYPSF|nr:hypothetical protein HYPSUDRAFT_68571 [Hypholoma sublateritium FD-334 SS-4]